MVNKHKHGKPAFKAYPAHHAAFTIKKIYFMVTKVPVIYILVVNCECVYACLRDKGRSQFAFGQKT